MKAYRILMALVALVLVVGLTAGMTAAQSTTKSMATNFTLVNLSPNDTEATVNYYLPDGSEWKAPDVIPVAGNGGQAILRQYQDAALTAGSGSVVVSALEPLAGLVQEVVDPSAGEVPTSAAYTAISEGSSVYYIPQVSKNGASATGVVSTWIVIQNLGADPVDVTVSLTKYGETTATDVAVTGLAAGASYYLDLDVEASITDGFYSAVVDAGTGTIGVVANSYFGADGLMAVNAFPQEALTGSWSVPLVFSRLTNTLVTSLIFQNLSGVEIPANDLNLHCTPDPLSADQSTLDLYNTAAIPANGIVAWNTLTQTTLFPTNWYGPCTVVSATDKGIVGVVQYRYSGNLNMAAYEAIPSTSTDTTVFVPLAAKQLTNKFCTAITIMNLSSSDITVDIAWTHSGGAGTDYAETAVPVTANGSIIRNLCLATHPIGVDMPATWIGTMTATGTGPVAAFVQNRYNPATGDQYQAYLGITQP